MKGGIKWTIIIVFVIIMSMVIVSSPVAACFHQLTTCEGEYVAQGDGGSTDYWIDDIYPPMHYLDPGTSTEWIINVKGGYGCSDYEHCTVTDNTPPAGWTTTIEMGTITTGSFHYIDDGSPVNEGDNIEGREFYIGLYWEYNITYRITAPNDASGGEYAYMICELYLVGYLPENQHNYVYVHCNAIINAIEPPAVVLNGPNGGEVLNGTAPITWDASSPGGNPLSFDIYLSSDGGLSFPDTLVTGLGDAVRSWDWDTTSYPDDVDYQIRIIVFDGEQYGNDISENDFALDNYEPEPPSNLMIHFGLTTDGEATAKAPDDDTGSALERLQKDDGRGYVVQKGKTLSMETFNTATQTDPIESATLYVEYWVENTGYSGTNSVMWKLEADATYSSTGITPINTESMPVLKSFDLFANGVDTIDEIANLDILFTNSDGGVAQNVTFDYIWIEIKGSPNDIGLTWSPSTSPDLKHYHVDRSLDGVTYSHMKCTSLLYWNDVGKAIDLNNYYYKVYSFDTGGKEGQPTYTVAKFVSSVDAGWNMISTPLVQQQGGLLDNAFHSIDSSYDSVQSYNAGSSTSWTHWHLSKPSHFNSLTDIDHLSGYYIRMKTSEDFITIGKLPASELIPLKSGWNLVGYPSLTSQLRDNALSSIIGEVNVVYRFDAVTQREVEVLASDSMMPGNAYWIHVSNDCDLTL